MAKYDSLTEGRVASVLIRFSIPFLLSGLIQMAYSVVDVYFIGKFASAASLSGVSQGAVIMMTITSTFMGVTSGGMILLGQYIGAKLDREAAAATGNVIVVFLAAVVIILTGLFIFGKDCITLLKVPEEATGEAWAYMKICLYGIVFTMGYSLISSILRSLGNSKAPFYFVLISCLVNIALDYIFVGLLSMAAAGAALATVIAQTLSFVISLFYIIKKKLPFPFSIKNVKPDFSMIKRILKIGIPVSLQSSLNVVSFLVIMMIANSMGLFVSAATSVVFSIANLLLIIPVAFGSAIAAITAQNIGAKKPERALKSMWLGLLISLVVLVPIFIVMAIFPKQVVGIISSDPDVIRESVRFLYPNIMDSIFVCFIFCMYGFFNGCGKTMFVMLSETLAAFLVRIPVSYLMKVLIADSTIFHVGLGTPIASAVTFIACIIYMFMKFSGKKLQQIEVVH